MPSLQIIEASTSGHTEYVVGLLTDLLRRDLATWTLLVKRAEEAQAADLLAGDVLLLASSTWNTGGQEGQLNPHMFALLRDRANDVDLTGRKVALIALGDDRYFYTAGAGAHLQSFVAEHHGVEIIPMLTIVNEPYGQEEKVKHWGEELMKTVQGNYELRITSYE
ncbi:flavodoxin domain-containing protein [Candidatus Peregrinibacteria bacterium]|nr:flavodoxin domain-containing protein [Candidatus Peregrinibacteria bacterium]MBI3816776.1 flavodoxin domain-containing protein [Candidatus Peregrinibacteria bacterium]